MLSGKKLRQMYLDFFVERGHIVIPPAPLVLSGDPTTLFTGSGMQPMMPYLLGQPHPLGVRLVDSQPCFRAGDIDEVGDNRHTTFFEMLGNWSLGDYFKKEQLAWFFEFVVDKVGLDPNRLYVSVFNGDPANHISKDEISPGVWQSLFKSKGITAKVATLDTLEIAAKVGMGDARIFYYEVAKNWWARNGHTPATMPVGEPGGPDSEMFYDFGTPHDPSYGENCHPNCDCGRFMEFGNSVFMEFLKLPDSSFVNLPAQNVDFGGGLERILAVKNNNPDMFTTDLFLPIIRQIETFSGKTYEGANQKPIRVITDHLKASVFMIAEGVEPSNKQQGYALRRLLRRSAVKLHELNSEVDIKQLSQIVDAVYAIYGEIYFKSSGLNRIKDAVRGELSKFEKSLNRGLKEVKKHSPMTPEIAFDLYQTYGFPLEILEEISGPVDHIAFDKLRSSHSDFSRTASGGMFKGGLADQSETTTKYHTTTHLLQQALRDVLGDSVHQAGSNITGERLRFDFTYDKALTPDQLAEVAKIINEKIAASLPVTSKIMEYEKALASGALAFFKQKYPPQVTVYSIGDYSQELCGGPHVTNTSQIGNIEISRQESVGSATRRIYLTLSAQNGNQKPL